MATTNLPTREPRIAKADVPVNALKDQTSVALYFEYTMGVGMRDEANKTAKLQFTNVALFAVDKHLLVKRHISNVEAPFGGAATITSAQFQAQFRDEGKNNGGTELTHEDAFLTVMQAWEFATRRPTVAYYPTANGHNVTVGVNAAVSEALMFPIGEADTKTLRDDTSKLVLARKIARNAESMWAALSVEGTSTRLDSAASTRLDNTSALGKFAAALVSKEYTEFPLYDGLDRSTLNTAGLRSDLAALAQGETNWL